MLRFLILLWLSTAQLFIFGQVDLLKTEIEKLIHYDTDISFKQTPGFIIGIIDDDSTYIIPFGRKTKDKKAALTDSDVFEVGSITKVFTAALAEILIAEGFLDDSKPINTYLPVEYRNPRMDGIILSDLIFHTSGLPKRPAFFGTKEKDPKNPYAYYRPEDLLQYYRDFIPEKSGFEYAHTNYALLEIVIEHATDKNFGDLLDEKIFKPLSMHRSFVDFPERRSDIIVKGYDRSGKETPPWTFESFKGSEGLKISMQDMLNFMKVYLTKSYTYLDSILPVNLHPEGDATFNNSMSMAKGWQTLELRNSTVFSHTGKTTGHTAFAAMVPATRTAVVILSNSANGTEDLGIQILRMINFNWKRKPYKS
jgi:CubicO group peptidase (beta-lactamase class C family)